ncbi:MAG: DUF5615 family PIN-like protein [Melioribacteraceae bacterium]|nr:DUF5615 family PIN-like protein [Melioribacteraceae bacterium]
MKFFLDENFPKKVARLLNNRNYEIIDIRGTASEGLTDIEIFNLAQENKAVFLTTDKDFFHTIPFNFPEHSGVIVIALDQPNSEKILQKLEWLLNNYELSKLANKTLLLKENTYFVR